MLRIVTVFILLFCCGQSSFGQDYDKDALARTEPKKGEAFEKLKVQAKGQTAQYWQAILDDTNRSRAKRIYAAQALYFHGEEKNTIRTLIKQLWGKDGLVGLHAMQTVVFLCPKDQDCLDILMRLIEWDTKKQIVFSDFCLSKIFQAIGKYGARARPYFSKFLPYFKRQLAFVDFQVFIQQIGIRKKDLEPLFEAVLTAKGSLGYEKPIAALGKDCIPAIKKYMFSKDRRQIYLALRTIDCLAKNQPELALTLFPELLKYAGKFKAGVWIGQVLAMVGEKARPKVLSLTKSVDEIEQQIALEYYAKLG
ncbi:MAG: hypothetical protein P1V97_09535, partial [Planctomycetota bacterium]|nr:hypothetical protein [Planctomycetota bacterium]